MVKCAVPLGFCTALTNLAVSTSLTPALLWLMNENVSEFVCVLCLGIFLKLWGVELSGPQYTSESKCISVTVQYIALIVQKL